MEPTPAPAYGMSAQYFPHHPQFAKVEPIGGQNVRYTFIPPFTGDETEPEVPDRPKFIPEKDRTDEDKARLQEFYERRGELEAAHNCWEEARYYRQLKPLVMAALNARPPVDEALAAMRSAFAALDNALVWPVAVKQLLDAQDNAHDALARWVDNYAYPLAKAEGQQSYYIREHVGGWNDIAAELNGGQGVDWEIGWYYPGDRHTRAGYSDSPRIALDDTIRTQRAKLEQIARYSGERQL
jgi:hypothetical protein